MYVCVVLFGICGAGLRVDGDGWMGGWGEWEVAGRYAGR